MTLNRRIIYTICSSSLAYMRSAWMSFSLGISIFSMRPAASIVCMLAEGDARCNMPATSKLAGERRGHGSMRDLVDCFNSYSVRHVSDASRDVSYCAVIQLGFCDLGVEGLPRREESLRGGRVH